MKLTIKGPKIGSRVLVALFNEREPNNPLHMDQIYYNDLLPKNRIIELPDSIEGETVLIRIRKGFYLPLELVAILDKDTQITIAQQYEFQTKINH